MCDAILSTVQVGIQHVTIIMISAFQQLIVCEFPQEWDMVIRGLCGEENFSVQLKICFVKFSIYR